MNLTGLFIKYLIYPYMEHRRGNRIRAYLAEMLADEKLPPGAIRELQDAKLRRLLLHCVENVPAYRDFSLLKPLIESDPMEALKEFPLLSKRSFNENPDLYLAAGADKGSLILNRTGGSTGEPVRFYFDRATVEHYEAARWRGLSWWGITPYDPSVMVWGSPIELCEKQQFVNRLKERFLKNRILISAYSLNPGSVGAYVREINRFKTAYLYGYASSLTILAGLMQEQGLSVKVRIKGVVSTAETLHEHQREILEEVFKAPVINEYGARDGGIIAMQCPAGSLHVTDDHLVLEIVDPVTGEPVPPGQTGAAAVTDLNNYVMPRLRYLVGDMARMSAAHCSCGRGLSVLESVEGREVDTFISRTGELVYGGYWNCLVRDMVSIRQYQLVQHDPHHVTLSIVRNQPYYREEEEFLVGKIREVLGAEVEVRYVDAIPPAPSGKIRYAVREFPLPGLEDR